MLADDCSVSHEQLVAIRAAADRALRDGGALGIFPTPVDDIMAAARIEMVPLAIDEGYLAKLRRKAENAGKALLTALSKAWGVFDPRSRIAFIDPETPDAKLPFLKLHEGGHALLEWQSIFGLFEDCRMTLDPFIKAQFEREANVFASEVLFQMDIFAEEAGDLTFGMAAPLQLAKRYGASVYATARRYVMASDRVCAVLIFNPPIEETFDQSVSSLRRVVASPSFEARFPAMAWPREIRSREAFARLIPDRRMTRPRTVSFLDANGDRQEFIAESFRSRHQTLVLLHAVATLQRRVYLPAQHSLSLF
ncbi:MULTISPECIES: ImmA/IrrE family metallo-endopeptidase [unclassified Sphingopyxis]|uniref:ImmA/IrrE family metallo-endopeptidase n=1 Tax=unclassified Sphingopyxis TaxID=2614943 RepID=UPI002862C08E|nr:MULTISPECIES: ImmA/IrrE family metallo-endopeptidase [unclassified Sphingopyxis]MDR7062453.1 Zn-dependent peptidase ImmA (M78 family) [Sphingopyxis sp. BE235]MDR7182847.1 Zn-dependent peptidase ImmA (M78 family) [Sphingopyxis sp. BE249]